VVLTTDGAPWAVFGGLLSSDAKKDVRSV